MKKVKYRVTGPFGSLDIGTVLEAYVLFEFESNGEVLLFHPPDSDYASISTISVAAPTRNGYYEDLITFCKKGKDPTIWTNMTKASLTMLSKNLDYIKRTKLKEKIIEESPIYKSQKDISKKKNLVVTNKNIHKNLTKEIKTDQEVKEDKDEGKAMFQNFLQEVFDYTTKEKGELRHGNGRPLLEQDWKQVADATSIDFLLGQSLKKLMELRNVDENLAWEKEIKGAISYAVFAVMYNRLKDRE